MLRFIELIFSVRCSKILGQPQMNESKGTNSIKVGTSFWSKSIIRFGWTVVAEREIGG